MNFIIKQKSDIVKLHRLGKSSFRCLNYVKLTMDYILLSDVTQKEKISQEWPIYLEHTDSNAGILAGEKKTCVTSVKSFIDDTRRSKNSCSTSTNKLINPHINMARKNDPRRPCSIARKKPMVIKQNKFRKPDSLEYE